MNYKEYINETKRLLHELELIKDDRNDIMGVSDLTNDSFKQALSNYTATRNQISMNVRTINKLKEENKELEENLELSGRLTTSEKNRLNDNLKEISSLELSNETSRIALDKFKKDMTVNQTNTEVQNLLTEYDKKEDSVKEQLDAIYNACLDNIKKIDEREAEIKDKLSRLEDLPNATLDYQELLQEKNNSYSNCKKIIDIMEAKGYINKTDAKEFEQKLEEVNIKIEKPLSDMKKTELQEEAKNRGIDTNGMKKDEIIKAIEANDNQKDPYVPYKFTKAEKIFKPVNKVEEVINENINDLPEAEEIKEIQTEQPVVEKAPYVPFDFKKDNKHVFKPVSNGEVDFSNYSMNNIEQYDPELKEREEKIFNDEGTELLHSSTEYDYVTDDMIKKASRKDLKEYGLIDKKVKVKSVEKATKELSEKVVSRLKAGMLKIKEFVKKDKYKPINLDPTKDEPIVNNERNNVFNNLKEEFINFPDEKIEEMTNLVIYANSIGKNADLTNYYNEYAENYGTSKAM